MTTPGDLFLQLWPVVQPEAASVVAKPWHGRFAAEFNDLLSLLSSEDGIHVPQPVLDYLAGNLVSFRCEVSTTNERAFVVMCAIDQVTVHIHPAFDKRAPSGARPVAGMLTAMKQRRRMEGAYATGDQGMVVPKGNLQERCRPDEKTFSGADLAHQFRHLSMIQYPADGSRVRLVAVSATHFLADATGAERVGVAPIAQDRDDIEFHVTSRLGSPFLDARSGAVDLHSRIEHAVVALLDQKVGVILMPELVVPKGSADRLSAHLKALGRGSSSLVVAGTGVSTEVSPMTGRPYNQAHLMSSNGRILGVQRKVHPFNMRSGRMVDCSIPFAAGCDNQSHMEDVTGSNELVILDLEGLGRVMILICEDLEQQTPTGDVALAMRPDWILTPVLDVALDPGRWTHGRGMEIGRRTWSRIVVSNSSTLAKRHAETDPSRAGKPINTAICLESSTEHRVKFVALKGTGVPEYEVVDWDPAHWELYLTKPA